MIDALGRWTDDYLIKQMGDRKVSVAVTPNGYVSKPLVDDINNTMYSRADAVTPGPDGMLYFVEPHTQQMTMCDFLSTLSHRTGWRDA